MWFRSSVPPMVKGIDHIYFIHFLVSFGTTAGKLRLPLFIQANELSWYLNAPNTWQSVAMVLYDIS